MSALAVEIAPAPAWAGHDIARAPGSGQLHVVLAGVAVPQTPVFTVPLECEPNAAQAPGVRSWSGPVEEARVCPACLRALRGEPAEPVRSPAAGTCPLPGSGSNAHGRRLWAVPDPVSYTPAALPAEHRGKPITWSPWTKAPVLTHFSSACSWCEDPGPCEMAGGRQGNPMSSRDPLRRFVAYRCSRCQEMTAYEQVGGDLKTVAHYKSRAPKGNLR